MHYAIFKYISFFHAIFYTGWQNCQSGDVLGRAFGNYECAIVTAHFIEKNDGVLLECIDSKVQVICGDSH